MAINQLGRVRFRFQLCIWAAFCLMLISTVQAQQEDYLSAEDAMAIGAGSLALWGLGNYVKRANADVEPRWVTPTGIDAGMIRLLGGTPRVGRQNLLDSKFGSGITATMGSLGLAITDLSYPRDDKDKEFWQDQFIYFGGSLATKGLTDLFKGLVARQRPFVYYAPDVATQRERPHQPFDHYSFFSGHTSNAFFAMTYLNKRIRSTMRNELTPAEYRNGRWIPSALTYTWATLVAFSRVHAYRHYLTDVLAGALAGYLMGELYYSFNHQIVTNDSAAASPLYIELSFSF